MNKPLFKQTPQEIFESFRALSPRQQVTGVGAVVGGILFIYFMLIPAWFVRPLQEAQMANLRTQIVTAQAQIQREPEIKKDKEEYEAFVAQVGSQLLNKADLQRLLGILSELAQESGMTILGSQPQSESAAIPAPFDKDYQVFTYVLSLEGGYHDLATFVSKIESYPKILTVEEISLTPRNENPSVQVGEVRFSVFLRKEAMA